MRFKQALNEYEMIIFHRDMAEKVYSTASKPKASAQTPKNEKNPNKFFLVHLVELIHIRENFTQFHLFFSFFSCFCVILGP